MPTALARPVPAVQPLIQPLVARWNHGGAPRHILHKAERARPGFLARHAPIRRDRARLASAGWLLALGATTLVALLLTRLVHLASGSPEALVRLLVSALLTGLAASAVHRASGRLPLLLAGLIGLSLIHLAGAPESAALARWDLHAVLLGWAIALGKAVRMWLDSQLDALEAELLLKAAGCR